MYVTLIPTFERMCPDVQKTRASPYVVSIWRRGRNAALDRWKNIWLESNNIEIRYRRRRQRKWEMKKRYFSRAS